MLGARFLSSFGLVCWVPTSCCIAATNEPCPPLPSEIIINKEAGRGGPLIVQLRLDGGSDLPFLLDTGAPVTTIDKSFEPKLGKRLGTTNIFSLMGDKQRCGIYASPRLYLNGTPLLTSTTIVARNSSRPGQRIMGILGMDCLKNYCIQLDFEAGKLRFLDPESARPGHSNDELAAHVGTNLDTAGPTPGPQQHAGPSPLSSEERGWGEVELPELGRRFPITFWAG